MTDLARLRTLIARIELISQVPAAQPGQASKSADDDIGGRRPSGGIDRKDDREQEFSLKSVDYFRRRLARCHTDRAVLALIVECEATLEAWAHTPIPEGQPPEYGSAQWKHWVGVSVESVRTLADRFGVSPQYISQVRREYKRAA